MATLPLRVDGKQARDELGRFVKGADKARSSADKLNRSMRRAAAAFISFRTARQAILLIAKFEESLLTLQGVTGATADQMRALEDAARDAGASTRFSAQEAAEGLTFLARAGFEAEEAIAALPATLDLALAGVLGVGEAADIASNVLNQFNLSVFDTERAADVLVRTANAANTNVRQLAEALKLAGPIANAAGVSLEDTAATLGVLGDAGIQASLAGTNLRGVLLGISAPSEKAKKTLDELGLSARDVNPATRDLVDIFEDLGDGLDGLGAEGRLAALDAIFGRRNAAAAEILTQSTEKLGSAFNEAGLGAKALADIQGSGLLGSFKALGSAIQETTLALLRDSGFDDALQSIVDQATDVLRAFGEIRRANEGNLGLNTASSEFLKLSNRARDVEAQVRLAAKRLEELGANPLDNVEQNEAAVRAWTNAYVSNNQKLAELQKQLDSFTDSSRRSQEIQAQQVDAQQAQIRGIGEIRAALLDQIALEGLSAEALDRENRTRAVANELLQKGIDLTPELAREISALLDLQDQQRGVTAVNATIAALEQETRLVGLSVRERERQLAVIAATDAAGRELSEGEIIRIRATVTELQNANTAREESLEAAQKFQESLDEQAAAAQRFGDAFASAVTDPISDLATGRIDSDEFFETLIRNLQETAVQLLIIKPLFEALSGSATGGANGGGTGFAALGQFFLNANGNAFSGGRVIPFQQGGVIDRPLLFPMANSKVGLMGEAGPEAVLPLQRGADGRLGVQASNATRPVSVTMVVNGVRDPDGFARSERQISNRLVRSLQSATGG